MRRICSSALKNLPDSSTYLAARGDFPRTDNLTTAGYVNFIVHVDAGAHMVRNDGKYLADKKRVVIARLDKAVLFIEFGQAGPVDLHDASIATLRPGAQQIGGKCLGSRVYDHLARHAGGDYSRDHTNGAFFQGAKTLEMRIEIVKHVRARANLRDAGYQVRQLCGGG